jgi:type I restriction enzyme M protein
LDIDYTSEMARIQDEMRLLMVSEKLSQSMLEDAFRGIGYGIE